jgi:hypothetical protein
MEYSNPFVPTSEFGKRYRGCYFYVTLNGKRHLVRMDAILEETATQAKWYARSPKLGRFMLEFDSPKVQVDFSFPEIGFFSHNGRLFYLDRYSFRQWKRVYAAKRSGSPNLSLDQRNWNSRYWKRRTNPSSLAP